MDINIEHLRKEHLDEVWTLNFKAWYEDDSNSYDIDSVKARANLDLRDMLAVGTYALVAVDGEKVVGIAIANSVYSDNTIAMYDGSSTEDAFRIATGSEESINDFIGYHELEKAAYTKMLSEANQEFDGELVLLITAKSHRGQGIGKQLLEEIELYFKTEGVKNYFIKTDDSCNYNFYDRYGLNKLAETSIRDVSEHDSDYKFYVYGNTLDEL